MSLAALDAVTLSTALSHLQTPGRTVTRRKPTRRIFASAGDLLRARLPKAQGSAARNQTAAGYHPLPTGASRTIGA